MSCEYANVEKVELYKSIIFGALLARKLVSFQKKAYEHFYDTLFIL